MWVVYFRVENKRDKSKYFANEKIKIYIYKIRLHVNG